MQLRGKYIFIILAVAVVYFISARFGLFLAFENSNSTSVWPPSGIALAAILIFGIRIFPGIALGAFAVNVYVFLFNNTASFPDALWISFIISIGNTSEAILGYYLLKKFSENIFFFQKSADVFRFALIGFFICLSSSLIGSIVVAAAHIISWEQYPLVLFTWWLGDLTGILLLTPFILFFSQKQNFKFNGWNWQKSAEAILLLCIMLFVGSIIFLEFLSPDFAFTRAYLVIPLLFWAALRFGLREVMFSVLLISALAIAGGILNKGPFVHHSFHQNLLSVQGFVAVISITFLAMGASLYERKEFSREMKFIFKRRTKQLSSSQKEIELFRQRTEELLKVLIRITQLDFSKKANLSGKGDELDAIAVGLNSMSEELQYYLKKQKESENKIRLINAQLNEAQRLSHIGSWEWDIPNDKIFWTDELYRIYGFNPQEFKADYQNFLKYIHPEDVNFVNETVQRSYQNHQPFSFYHRIVRPNGEERILFGRGEVFVNEKNQPVRMAGTAQDVTEIKQAEQKLMASENKFKALLESAPDATLMVNSEGKIIMANAQMENLFGYKKEELMNKEVEFLIPQRFSKNHSAHRNKFFTEPLARPMGMDLELYGKRKNGEEFPLEVSLSPMKTEEGMIVSAAIRDITIRKKAQEKIRYQASLIENILDAAVSTDIHFIVQSWNEGAEKIYGWKADEILGKFLPDFLKTEFPDNGTKEKAFAQLKQDGNYSSEIIQSTKDGKRINVFATVNSLKNERGEMLGLVAINRNITEFKKAEKQLQKRTEELALSNRELEQFAYVASHDLQEPLRMVNSYVQLLEKKYKDKLDDEALEFIRFAVDGTQRMRLLINSLLEFSRLNRKKSLETINTNKLLLDILHISKESIQKNNADITIGKLPEIHGDPALISQLFQNLLSNAIKFKGEKEPKIHFSAKHENGALHFSVKDNGIGIKEEYHEKIFVIFKRLHNREKYPGTGIGLAICKKIVERHGGKIWVESEEGKGSIFNFTIFSRR